MEKIFYLPIETIAREFDARMLLTHEALSRGYSVITGQRSTVYKAAEVIQDGIYFYKSHGYENFPKSKDQKNKAFKYISLDEEGLVFVDDEQYLVQSKPDKLSHLDIVFTWGSYQRNLLVKENPELKEKTVAVGNPRFDLLRPEFNFLYKKSSEKICRKWGKYVLINTMFVPGNFSRLYGCSYLESREHQFKVIIGRPPSRDEKKFLIEEEQYYKKLFKQYVEMLELLSARFPEINFILRPHPSEDILNWKEALKSVKNVHVIFKGSAVEWISGALLLIHTGCTTGIEAWVMGKQVIAYNPNTKSGIEPPLPNKFGLKVNNVKDLGNIVNDALGGESKKISGKQMEVATAFITSVDGDYSVKRYMDALDSLPDKGGIESKNREKNIYMKLSGIENFKGAAKIKILKSLSKYQPAIKKYAGRKISGFIYDRFKKYPGLMAQFKKFPGLKKKEIRNRLAVYDKILNNEHSKEYCIKKIATDTYYISAEI